MKSNPKQKAVYLALCILAARCLLGSLFAGNASALLFSLLGGTLAMLVMLALSRLPPPALRPTAAIGYIIVWNAAYFKAVSPQLTENHRKIQEKGCQCPAFMLYYAEE